MSLEREGHSFVCLTCGGRYKGIWGNNPHPINQDESLVEREVCGDCNSMYVIPARLGKPVQGKLYDESGSEMGTFGTVDA